jgi:hypothetical protein
MNLRMGDDLILNLCIIGDLICFVFFNTEYKFPLRVINEM